MNNQWVAQVFVRKTRMEVVEENSKKSLLNTLDKNSPFDLKILALKLVDITTEMSGKN